MDIKRLSRSIGAAAGCAATVLVNPTVHAAPPGYRHAMITEGYTVSDAEVRRLKMNSNGEVVGTLLVNGNEHAFVWLPEANPNYPSLAKGLTDLHVHFNLDAAGIDNSIAHDINPHGYIAGQVRIAATGEYHAFAWKLSEPTKTFDIAEDFTLVAPLTKPLVAWSLNDETPPVAVGQAHGIWGCDGCFPAKHTGETTLGFQVTLQSGATVYIVTPYQGDPEPPVDCHQHSIALHINDNQIVGVGWGPPNCFFPPSGECQPNPIEAVAFGGSGILLDDLGPEAEPRCSNNAGQIVGLGWEGEDPCQHQKRALFWESASSPDVTLESIPPGEWAAAEAINNALPRQVVGANTVRSTALLWEKSGSSWNSFDLNELLHNCSGNWSLRRADDINDSGWIVVIADPTASSPIQEKHAFVLKPVEYCVWDIAGPPGPDGPPDGDVGSPDFLKWQASWGPCPTGDFCLADYDCDREVDVQDFLLLLDNWGPCNGDSAMGAPQALYDCIAIFGGDDIELLSLCCCAAMPEACK